MRYFSRVWTKNKNRLKIFDKKNSIKIAFLATFLKVVAKNRAFGNNLIFLQQVFNFGGGGTFPFVGQPKNST